jgi:sec-independent protein translocase protein TatA
MMEIMMGSMSIMHWLLVAAVALLLFGGRGKLSGLMKDAAEGIKGFRKGLADEPAPTPPQGPDTAKSINDPKTVDAEAPKAKADAWPNA